MKYVPLLMALMLCGCSHQNPMDVATQLCDGKQNVRFLGISPWGDKIHVNCANGTQYQYYPI